MGGMGEEGYESRDRRGGVGRGRSGYLWWTHSADRWLLSVLDRPHFTISNGTESTYTIDILPK